MKLELKESLKKDLLPNIENKRESKKYPVKSLSPTTMPLNILDNTFLNTFPKRKFNMLPRSEK